MSVLVIVLLSIAAYFATGAVYARSRAVDCLRRAKAEWGTGAFVQSSLNSMLAWRVVFWPYAVIFDAVRRGMKMWMMAPIKSARNEAESLREEAARYDVLINGCDNAADRELMRKGQEALLDQADAVDL